MVNFVEPIRYWLKICAGKTTSQAKHFKWFIANFYDTDRICKIWGIDCEVVGGCGLIQFRAQNIVDCYIGGIGNSINFGDNLQVVPVYLVMIVKNPIGIWCV